MNASPDFRGGLSRAAARVIGSRFAKPIARVALVAASVAFLAVIGYAAAPRALGGSASAATSANAAPQSEPKTMPTATSTATDVASAPPVRPPPASRGAASPDDPVILNSATVDDFRRLPGIGEKRANAILALRSHLGRFRAIEDLLKVKGVGRATLKRLRPLVRLDLAPAAPDAGNLPSSTPPR